MRRLRIVLAAGLLWASAIFPAAAQKTRLTVYTALENEQLAPYKIPKALCVVDALPRNPMGKVIKTEVARLFS